MIERFLLNCDMIQAIDFVWFLCISCQQRFPTTTTTTSGPKLLSYSSCFITTQLAHFIIPLLALFMFENQQKPSYYKKRRKQTLVFIHALTHTTLMPTAKDQPLQHEFPYVPKTLAVLLSSGMVIEALAMPREAVWS